MAYSADIATLLQKQLAKFVTLNRHQLAGQVANLEFWLAEVAHGLAVVDGYESRFKRLKDAQRRHVKKYETIEFDLRDPCCISGPASPPRRVPEAELWDARRSLCETVYRFLLRCFKEGMIEEAAVREVCRRFDLSVEANDLGVQ